MASHGIRDKVAIIGMGCTNFGEHWDKSTDDMLIESSDAALKNVKWYPAVPAGLEDIEGKVLDRIKAAN